MEKKSQSPSKIVKKSSEIKTDSSDDELADEVSISMKMQNLSPTKYFGKRISFDYSNLKQIEKPRRASAQPDSFKFITSDQSVKFSAKTEEVTDNIPKKQERKNDKKHSILKNTVLEEDVKIHNLFDLKINKDLVEKIEKFKEKNISEVFLSHFKEKVSDSKAGFLILKGCNWTFSRVLLKEGLDTELLITIFSLLQEFMIGNEEFTLNLLENLTRVKKFKNVVMENDKFIEEFFNKFSKLKNFEQNRLTFIKCLYKNK